MSIYDIGDTVRLTAAFADSAGTASDPTTVAITVRLPDQSVSTLSATRDSTGNYHADLVASQTGNHYYRFTGTGALVVAEEGEFYIRVRKV